MAVSNGSIKLRWVSTRRRTKGSAMSLVQAGRLDAQAAALVVRRLHGATQAGVGAELLAGREALERVGGLAWRRAVCTWP